MNMKRQVHTVIKKLLEKSVSGRSINISDIGYFRIAPKAYTENLLFSRLPAVFANLERRWC